MPCKHLVYSISIMPLIECQVLMKYQLELSFRSVLSGIVCKLYEL